MPFENVGFKAELPDDLYKEVMAFANTDGGTIYIGVDNQGNITGIDNVDDTYTRITNGICDAIQSDRTLPNMNSANKEKSSEQSLQNIPEIMPQMQTVMSYLKQYAGMSADDLQRLLNVN